MYTVSTMHVVVSKKDLQRILSRCQNVADKKSTMPVLGNVLIETEGDQLKLAATDLYLAVSGTIPAKIEKPGSIAVGARDLFERGRNMPEGELSLITAESSAMTIRAMGSARRYTLHGLPGEEFPSLPAADAGATELKLPTDVLNTLISATHFSISNDETRLHLSSALFEWEGESVRMVTTDGHRLSKIECRVPGRDANASMLIPNKGIQELRKLCDEAMSDAKGDDKPELSMTQSGQNAFFHMAGFQFSVKLVDAQFPPYQQVIPEAAAQAVRAPRSAVAEALKAVKVAASDRTGGVKLTIAGDKMRFESESPESGDGFDEVPVDYQGPELTIGFNANYFLDVLGAIADEDVLVAVSGELDPAVIKPGTESSDSSYLAVIMPMRI